ncbi:hypothetical protein [Sphingobium lignivorans]|uniref:Uncharacterized protein n=1 Tax=Sphingobium lignivorans TaxID=2735886 RepID=A0ABR6NFB3_9SPHN|nr:hypothetical protein [Sphingobium lignivorans]MBB5985961.1 hypothetical protein [Sphingobium lignivorans]
MLKMFSGSYVGECSLPAYSVVTAVEEPSRAKSDDDMKPGRFYTLVPKRDASFAGHFFELLAVNDTHIMVRCMNPARLIPAEPILLLRSDFTMSDATDIARAAAQHGNPVLLKQPEEPSMPGGWQTFRMFR